MSTYCPKGSTVFYFDFVIDGQRHYGSTRCKTKRDAEKVEAKLRAEAMLSRGQRKRQPITIDEAAALYEDRLRANGKWSPTQDYLIASIVEGIGGTKLLSAITQADLAKHFARRAGQVSAASVNREIEVARPIWRNVRRTHDIGEMPEWGELRYAVAGKTPRELYHNEEDALFEKLRPDLQDFAMFALRSGWRLAEVRKLRWSDLNLGQGIATTRIKGGDQIARPLSEDMKVLIANQPREGAFVFTYVCQKNKRAYTDAKGRQHPARLAGERYPFTQWGWRGVWARALKEAGIDAFRFHDLRHTRGTQILRSTGNLVLAQKALAHRSIKTTTKYAHASDEDVRRGLDVSSSRSIPEVADETAEKPQKTAKN
jgi:integrase